MYILRCRDKHWKQVRKSANVCYSDTIISWKVKSRKMQQICIFVTKQNMSRRYAFLVYFDSDKSDLIQASRQKNVAKDPVKNILVTVMV